MRKRILKTVTIGGLVAVILLATLGLASAAESPVGLGTAKSFAILAGATVTNTGPSVISGDLGVSPGTAITGFPPGRVTNGTQHSDTPVARQAQDDLTIAYNDAAGRSPTASLSLLGGQTLSPGVYNAPVAMGLTGTVTLDGENNPDSVFIFQVGTTLITEPDSTVTLIRGAQACNVFWQVGSSATLGTDTIFVGTIMTLTSATLTTGATMNGRVLARNGAVTLDTNTVSRPTCGPMTPITQPPSPDDGNSDTGNNGGSDTGNNGSSDTGNDGSSDTGNDGGSDTGNDGDNDTGNNSSSDTENDGDNDAENNGDNDTGNDDDTENNSLDSGSDTTGISPTVEERPHADDNTILPRTGATVVSLFVFGSTLLVSGILLRTASKDNFNLNNRRRRVQI